MEKSGTRRKKISDNIVLGAFKTSAVAGHILSSHQSIPGLGGYPTFSCQTHERKSLEDIDTDGYRELMSAYVPPKSFLSLIYSPTDEEKQRWFQDIVFLPWTLKSTDKQTYTNHDTN